MSFMLFWTYAMCDFPVITRFDFYRLCDNGIRFRSVPFHFGWCVLPCCPWGKRFLDCVCERLLPMGPKEHMQKRSYLMHSLYCPWGKRKTLTVWVRLLSMEPRVCIPERTISCQLWMGGSFDQFMWLYSIFVINYRILDFMALEIILLVRVCSVLEHVCMLFFFLDNWITNSLG